MVASKCFLLSPSPSLSVCLFLSSERKNVGTELVTGDEGGGWVGGLHCSSTAAWFVSFLLASAAAARRQQIWPGEFKVEVKED